MLKRSQASECNREKTTTKTKATTTPIDKLAKSKQNVSQRVPADQGSRRVKRVTKISFSFCKPAIRRNSNVEFKISAITGLSNDLLRAVTARVPSPGSEGRLIPCLLPRPGAKATVAKSNEASLRADLPSKTDLSFYLSVSIALITGDYRNFSLLQITEYYLVYPLLGYETAILYSSTLFLLLSGPHFPNPPTSTNYLNNIKIIISGYLYASHLIRANPAKRTGIYVCKVDRGSILDCLLYTSPSPRDS